MENISKGIDNKLATITKMQLNYRQKKLDYATFALGNQVDLPPITSVLVRFPAVNKEKVDIKNSRKRKSIIELDRILENNNQRISSEDINRIIFASPMKNRITFQRTFFRSSLYCTIEDKQNKNGSKLIKNSSIDEKTKRQMNQLMPLLNKSQQQNQKIDQIKIDWLSDSNTLENKKSTKYSNVLDSNPESILERRKRQRSLRKAFESKFSQEITRPIQRYSPWRNDDLEDQLIL